MAVPELKWRYGVFALIVCCGVLVMLPTTGQPFTMWKPTHKPGTSKREVKSHSQPAKFQDKWVDSVLEALRKSGERHPHYYVDLAANEPYALSNTAFFDNSGWNGICIDGNPGCIERLRKSDRSCTVVDAAMDSCNGFPLTWVSKGVVGGIVDRDMDNKAIEDKDIVVTRLSTTLDRILDAVGAPKVISYLSLDVEGAEWRVLKNFPFHRYKFLTITIEKPPPWLNVLLINNGYVWMQNSVDTYDSFYIHSSISGSIAQHMNVPKAEEMVQALTKCKGVPGTGCPWDEKDKDAGPKC